jgi:hypothetical protein
MIVPAASGSGWAWRCGKTPKTREVTHDTYDTWFRNFPIQLLIETF